MRLNDMNAQNGGEECDGLMHGRLHSVQGTQGEQKA